MTAICPGGGSSGPRPGVNTSIYVDTQYVQSLLPPVLAWLYPYLPWMNGLAIGDVNAFCSTDPPSIPSVPTAADFLALISGGSLASALNVNQFLVDLTKRYLWDSLCQCNSGTATAPTAPTNPGTLPVVNPPLTVQPPTVTPCLTFDSGPVPLTMDAITGTGRALIAGNVRVSNNYKALPVGYTWIDWTVSVQSAGAIHSTYVFRFLHVPPSGSPATEFSGTISPGGTQTIQIYPTITSTPDYLGFAIAADQQTSAPVATDLCYSQVKVYCSGRPGTPQVACCPPDPLMMAMLSRLTQTVDLVQRQLVPFAYIPGTVHTGLSGAGTLSVSGLLGAKIDVTTMPTPIGRRGTTPTEYFDAGYISWGTADGYPTSQRLEHNPQLSLPPRASAYTELAYDLHPGVVVTITELVREP
jgi:hypothetical protein